MRRLRSAAAIAAILALAGCGDPTVAGKTTTTTNGGGALTATTRSGAPVPGARVLAARGWDTASGIPTGVDTLTADSTGRVDLPADRYAVVQVLDRPARLGAVLRRMELLDGNRRVVVLDSLRAVAGRWADRRTVPSARLYLDSTFSTVAAAEDGSFAFPGVPEGSWNLRMQGGSGGPRRMGEIEVGRGSLRFAGSGNVLLDGDTTGSPLLVDDFESGTTWPLLHQSAPAASPWYMWWMQATMVRPTSSDAADSVLRAIGPDSTRPGNSFHVRYAANGPGSWVALGLTNLEIDLSARGEICFSYRADTALNVVFQRDSVAGGRPTLSSSTPSSPVWRDVCLPISGFSANSETPDSLKTWAGFGRRVLVLEFQLRDGGTFLDLDDIRLR